LQIFYAPDNSVDIDPSKNVVQVDVCILPYRSLSFLWKTLINGPEAGFELAGKVGVKQWIAISKEPSKSEAITFTPNPLMISFVHNGLIEIICEAGTSMIIQQPREIASTKGVAIDIIEAPLGKEVHVQG
jgi:hypothetical protein